MQIALRIDLNIFCLAICLSMLATSLNLTEKRMMQNRLFSAIILTTSVMLALECLTWTMDGQPGEWIRIANYTTETALYLLTPVPPLIWSLYASYQLFHDMQRIKKMLLILAIPIVANTVLTLITPFSGLMFTIDTANVYHRGPAFWVIMAASYLPIAYALACSLTNRRRISKRLFMTLLMFAVPPVVFSVLQCLFYGLTLTGAGITVSLFIVHTSLQNQQFSLDYLTRVFGRRPLDNYLTDRIRASRNGRRFSLIMLDIDNFKTINDRFGHVAGDEALKDAATILKSCVRTGDFLARYAGDEFVIVLDTNSLSAPEQLVRCIRERTDVFNSLSHKPYSISFSAGFALYDTTLSREDFVSHVDALMYHDKFSRKSGRLSANDVTPAAQSVSA